MTLILGIDVETTGLDPERDEIIELGIVLWDWKEKKPLKIVSEYVKGEKDIPEYIQKLTGISNDIRNILGWYDISGIQFALKQLLKMNPIIMSHNAKFDSSFIQKIVDTSRHTWICSMSDIDYPEHCKSRKLSYLASDHGFINPFSHRAVFDVLTMLEIVKNYDLDKMIENSKSPKIILKALVSYEDNHKAKNLGYRWIDKIWQKEIRKNQYDMEVEKAEKEGFKAEIKS